MASVWKTRVTYGRRGRRVITEDTGWEEVTKAPEGPRVFTSASSANSALSSFEVDSCDSSRNPQSEDVHVLKQTLKLSRKTRQTNKENVKPSAPLRPRRDRAVRKETKGSFSSTGSEEIFDSVDKKKKRFDKRLLLEESSASDYTPTKVKRKKNVPANKKKPKNVESIEGCRKSAWDNYPSCNFSEFDSFDLVVETASESKKKHNASQDSIPSASKTPESSHRDCHKDSLGLFDTPQIPQIPKVNLDAVNAFSTSVGGNSFNSLSNSPAIEGCPSGETTAFMHTSSPRVDSGFEADRSGSFVSSRGRSRLSEANASPLADISAISEGSLSVWLGEVGTLPSINEDSISDFSHMLPDNKKQSASQLGLGKNHATDKEGHRGALHSHRSTDLEISKELENMVQLTEQLARLSAVDQHSAEEASVPVPEGHVSIHQTPKQYFTRQFAKSTKKVTLSCLTSTSKSVVQSTPCQQSSLFRKIVTRSVTKGHAEHSDFDPSQCLFDSHLTKQFDEDDGNSESEVEDEQMVDSGQESRTDSEDGGSEDHESSSSEECDLDVIQEASEETEESSDEDLETDEEEQDDEAALELDSGTRYTFNVAELSTDNPKDSVARDSKQLNVAATPAKDIISELQQLSRNLKVILTPVQLNQSGIVPSFRDKVLSQCDQEDVCSFYDVLTPQMMQRCRKIGEGVFGEVFRSEKRNQSIALKIIPIEGDFPVNDEPQKTFEEILPEIVISREVSALRSHHSNCTPNFVDVKRVSVVKGRYPQELLKQWDLYHEKKTSENDRPGMFDDLQLFLIFEFEDAGVALESYEFESLEEAKSILHQVVLTLAIAETQLAFEHRDLHWGNVLVKRQKRLSSVEYKLDGQKLSVDSCGVKASIIDFTLSRLTKDGCTLFNDLSMDPTLFTGKDDYQFDIYRMMREENRNEWRDFCPKTNVMWIHYVADKLLNQTSYQNMGSKEHKSQARQFRTFLRQTLQYDSAASLVTESAFFVE